MGPFANIIFHMYLSDYVDVSIWVTVTDMTHTLSQFLLSSCSFSCSQCRKHVCPIFCQTRFKVNNCNTWFWYSIVWLSFKILWTRINLKNHEISMISSWPICNDLILIEMNSVYILVVLFRGAKCTKPPSTSTSWFFFQTAFCIEIRKYLQSQQGSTFRKYPCKESGETCRN